MDLVQRFTWSPYPSLLLSRPNGAQYGHLGLEILLSYSQARLEGKAICFLWPRQVVNPGLVALRSPEVAMAQAGRLARAWWRCRWAARDLPRDLRDRFDLVTELACHEAGRELSRHILDPSIPGPLRGRLRTVRHRANTMERAGRAGEPIPATYFRRRLIETPVAVELPPAVRDDARRRARALGIADEARLVTVHAREPGFKRGREVQEKQVRLRKRRVRDDSTRNVDIATFLPAIDELVSRGYTVVRIGDPSMRAFSHPGVVDLATSPERTPELEIDCLMRSAFLLSGEAGPVGVAYLTNTPVLTVNATDPISAFPVRADGMCLLKTVIDRGSGRTLDAADMLSPSYLYHIRDTTRFEYVDNTATEVQAVTREMLALLEGHTAETPAQEEYRRRVTAAADALRSTSAYIRKWGTDEGFLGHGRVSVLSVGRLKAAPTSTNDAAPTATDIQPQQMWGPPSGGPERDQPVWAAIWTTAIAAAVDGAAAAYRIRIGLSRNWTLTVEGVGLALRRGRRAGWVAWYESSSGVSRSIAHIPKRLRRARAFAGRLVRGASKAR